MLKLLVKFKKQNILKFGVAALLIAVPLYPKFPLIPVPGSQVAIRLEDLLILLVSLVWIINVLPKIDRFFENKVNRAIIMFLAVGLLSVVSGVFLTQTIKIHIGFFHWLRRVEYLLALFIGFYVIGDRKDLAFYIKCLMLVIVFAFVYAVGQKYFAWPVITTQNYEYAKGIALRYVSGGHLVSTFAGHYDLATFIILTSPLFVVLLVGGKKAIKELSISNSIKFSRFLFLIIVAASFWLLVNAASRISIVSYLLSISVALLMTRKYKFIPIFLIITIVATILSSNLMDRYIRIFEVAIEKVLSSVSAHSLAAEGFDIPTRRAVPSPSPAPIPIFEDRSTSIRLKVEWPRALRALSKNPILGTGYSSITLATDNDYLRMLGEVGILGFFAFFLIMIRVINEIFGKFSRFSEFNLSFVFLGSILGAISGVMLNMVFIDMLEASKFAILFWLFVGFALKTAVISKNE